MTDHSRTATLPTTATQQQPSLQALLALSDAALEHRLLAFVRASGVKFRSRAAFERIGWKSRPDPKFGKFWTTRSGSLVRSPDALLWDLREPLLQDEALCCCCILLWRRACKYGARWIGGVETAAIPMVAGILAVNRASGGASMNGFYLRKKRKRDGLRRRLEGVPPPRGSRVLLVDDILNKGVSKKSLLDYCRANHLHPAALLVVVDTQSTGGALFSRICPVEAIFTRREVLGGLHAAPPQRQAAAPRVVEIASRERIQIAASFPSPPSLSTTGESAETMSPEDVELVRLARDTVLFAALSGGRHHPAVREDFRGSSGYLPFLGRYLEERAPVFTRISKREFKDGRWFNRLRGCQAVGLFDPRPGFIADMTVRSAMVSATRARKVRPGAAAFHKPVWPAEIGDLSLFVYVVERLIPTKARTADQLLAEGHDVRRWGLIAHANGYRGVVCGGLDYVPDVARQIEVACRKMQNPSEIRPHRAGSVTFTRMQGRWLYDPARPKVLFF
jgi:orotate phosphoribosyltransferase